MRVGYARVSTAEQNTAIQLAAFRHAGVHAIREEHQSSIRNRPVLDALLTSELQSGDTLIVYKLDRLARSMSHFVRIMERLEAKGVGLKSLTEPIDTETPQGRMFVQMLAVFAEFERELIRERCAAGQAAARARGQTWGRRRIFTHGECVTLAQMWRWGWEQNTLAAMAGCSISTLRDAIHKAENRGRWSKAAMKT